MLLLSPYDDQLVLQLDLEEGRNANALTAAHALIAWVDAIKEANAVIDPMSEVAVELVGAEAACLRLFTLLKFVDQKVLGAAADSLNGTPYIKKLVSVAIFGAVGGLSAAGAAMLLLPDQTHPRTSAPSSPRCSARVPRSPTSTSFAGSCRR